MSIRVDFAFPIRESKAIVAVVLRTVGIWWLQDWRIGDFLTISLCWTKFYLIKPFNIAQSII
ncbi:hypothetical protein [Nostoc sphaeroides]|uniref:Uncharacterized protein n=1 Tax=Nostoc sphaeroides CCNUC1 TaxID=2653204 RepID=A0A5P8W392_9NOSO|nr:hypothetical protein [Nostoc sphaeroides]MCC5630722.1 hypothetical protein [Nostoc sphaeroides CHAB 2801]QFS46746.1 hypothetical protein GXM_04227 [Nostoc sphaeroides CCNUC1]